MSERKLAHIERIVDIQPIEGADKIEVATVLGWKCVVQKGLYNIGDLVGYIEVDSIVPDIPEFEFLRERHFRVRTIKLRKQISQGLVIPLVNIKGVEGDDITEQLGITKYESQSDKESSQPTQPIKKSWWNRFGWYRSLTGKTKGFPTWINKTDEERIQNIPHVLSSDLLFDVTEKLDGQSATYWYKRALFGGEFGVCSRNLRKNEKDNSNWSTVAKNENIKQKLKKVPFNVCIQGEVVGPTIQGNKYKLNEKQLYIFNVYNIKTNTYLSTKDMIDFCKKYGFKHVPVVFSRTKTPQTVDEIVELSKGKSVLNKVVNREGVVWRDDHKTISFKVINPDFLLKESD